MKELVNSTYHRKIKSRSIFHYLVGLMPRTVNHFKASMVCSIARFKGAKIGVNCYLPLSLALKANKNLVVGNSSIIETKNLDLRALIQIGQNVIVNKGAEIIRASHYVDSSSFETYSAGIEIGDFAWITSNSLILPSCTSIGRGAIVGAGSVVVKNVNELEIVAGNPAVLRKKRSGVPHELVTESLQGRDLIKYISYRILK